MSHQCRRTHATKRTRESRPPRGREREKRSMRIAPTNVRLSPQLIGRGSTRTAPRGSGAWDRPIARLAPDSSRRTRPRGSVVGSWVGTSRVGLGPPHDRAPRGVRVFLNTYPVRCSARKILDRCTRASGGAARLCARVNSSVVRSGFSWTSRRSKSTSIGDRQPPPLAMGSSRAARGTARDDTQSGQRPVSEHVLLTRRGGDHLIVHTGAEA
jgi:hypothetical protein